MLNSTEHGISTAYKNKMQKIKYFLAFKLSDVVFILLIIVGILQIVGIIRIHEQDKVHAQFSYTLKCFITWGQGFRKIIWAST